MLLFSVLVVLNVLFRAEAAIPIPKVPDPPVVHPEPVPEAPPRSPESPESPESPGTGPGTLPPLTPNENPNVVAQQPPTQAELQQNLGKLEENLEDIIDTADKIKDLVDGLLSTSSTQSSATVLIFQTATSQSLESVSFTPTTTLPVSSFLPCRTYASIASSCAGATASWYNLNATAQASCACYRKATSTLGGCTETGAPVAEIPTFDANRFDGAVNACANFFQVEGYNNSANVLLQAELGLCGKAGDVLPKSNATTSATLYQFCVPSAPAVTAGAVQASIHIPSSLATILVLAYLFAL